MTVTGGKPLLHLVVEGEGAAHHLEQLGQGALAGGRGA